MLKTGGLLCFFLAFFIAPSLAQNPCSAVPTRAQVQMAVMARGGQGDQEVIYSCISYSDYNQKLLDTMTAYSDGFYLDYTCNSTTSWVVQVFNRDITGAAPQNRDAGTCQRCHAGASAPGHCDPCTSQCTTCTSQLCFVCDEGYDLSAGNICATSGALSDGIIAVIAVCAVLAVVFGVLLIAAIGLILYIVMFTKTEEIAHRRMKENKSPVSYQRRSQIGTFRQNPVFGSESGWTGGQEGRQEDGGWTNPLAHPKRPALSQLDTGKADEEEDEESIDEQVDEQVGGEDDDGYEI